VYQAGTLSGNPLAMAAGLAQLRELERVNGWAKLENLGAIYEALVRASLRKFERKLVFHRVGSMFCLFFTDQEVTDLNSAQRSSREGYGKFFHNCLDGGVYYAPSQFETGFISLAHTEADLREAAEVSTNALELVIS
jgi:glutamate-1-semialdehyde 2,1-aminomutase